MYRWIRRSSVITKKEAISFLHFIDDDDDMLQYGILFTRLFAYFEIPSGKRGKRGEGEETPPK